MGAPTIYRWDDTSAPQLNGVDGSLIALLKACLVDGYGSKAAAGWTMPYISTLSDIAAFRSSQTNGNGFFYRVVDDTDKNAMLYGYESMTDESTGTGATSGVYAYKSSVTTASTYRPWMLVADDQSFYLFIAPTVTTIGDTDDDITGIFAGDFVSMIDGDGYGSGVIGATAINSYSYFGKLTTWSDPTEPGHYAIRASSGASGESAFAMLPGSGPSGLYMGSEGPTHPINTDQALIARPVMNDGTAYSFRGTLPGLYYPCHDMPHNNFEIVDTDYMAMRISVQSISYPGQVLIKTTTGFRA